ncbi:MAG: 50S ribosomal protein L24 [Candidatus Hadarchaeota archaeon]
MSSKQPRKQRAAVYSAPLHIRHKFLSAPLSPDLRKKYGKRSLVVRKGDRVRVLKGDFKKIEGEVTKVNTKKHAIYISGITLTKADGTQIQRPVQTSKVMLLSLVEDKERMQAISRGKNVG